MNRQEKVKYFSKVWRIYKRYN